MVERYYGRIGDPSGVGASPGRPEPPSRPVCPPPARSRPVPRSCSSRSSPLPPWPTSICRWPTWRCPRSPVISTPPRSASTSWPSASRSVWPPRCCGSVRSAIATAAAGCCCSARLSASPHRSSPHTRPPWRSSGSLACSVASPPAWRSPPRSPSSLRCGTERRAPAASPSGPESAGPWPRSVRSAPASCSRTSGGVRCSCSPSRSRSWRSGSPGGSCLRMSTSRPIRSTTSAVCSRWS